MPTVRDALNRRWTVRRVWWPFGEVWFNPDDPDWLFLIGLVLTAPLVVAWPFWLLGRILGAPWTLVVRRQGKEIRREQVKGWGGSRQRMAEILEEARSEGGPELPEGATIS